MIDFGGVDGPPYMVSSIFAKQYSIFLDRDRFASLYSASRWDYYPEP